MHQYQQSGTGTPPPPTQSDTSFTSPHASVLLVLLPADLHSSSSSREFWPGLLKAGGGRWTRRLLQALPAQHTLHRITQGTTQIAQNTLHTQHTATHIEQNGWSLGADQLQLWIS